MIQTNQKFKNCHKSPETHRGHFFFQWRDRILLLNSKYRIVHVVPTVFGGRGGEGGRKGLKKTIKIMSGPSKLSSRVESIISST